MVGENLYFRPLAKLTASCSYESSLSAIKSDAASWPSWLLGSAPFKIDAAMREHILYGYLGRVRRGVLDHNTSAAVVCALHSGVSRKRSQTLAREICWSLGATSVKTNRLATSCPAQSSAVLRKLLSPSSGKRNSQRIAFGTLERMRSQQRKVDGSIFLTKLAIGLERERDILLPCKVD